MENTFSVRYDILIILALIISGCDSKKDYEFDPVVVPTRSIKIDSLYTTTEYIPTGGGDSLFSGVKGNFDVYSILKFDTIPGSYDSIFIKLKSDSTNIELQFYQVIDEWFEDSLYKWEDLTLLIDTTVVLDTSIVNTANPLIKLNDQSINVIDEYGIAIYSDSFYSFASREENEPKLRIYIGDSIRDLSCLGDLFIVNNPYDSLLTDTLLIGRGLDIKPTLFIPVDSLPSNRDNIVRAGLIFKVEEPLSFNIVAYDSGGFEYSSKDYIEGDTNFIEFDLRTLIQSDFLKSHIKVVIGAKDRLGGIDVKTLDRLDRGDLRIMWAEIGMK